MHRRLATPVVVLLLLGACSDDDKGTTGGADVTEDTGATSAVEVVFEGVDTAGGNQPDPDTSPSPNPGEPDTDGDGDGVCNTFGCPCGSNADCLDELCVEGPDGRVCSRPCVTECPDEDFACVPIVVGGSDPFNACVPSHPNLCKPCLSDTECRNELQPSSTTLCLRAPDPSDGSFCSSSCASTPCPDGYTCSDIELDGGGIAKQCVPTDGSCECRPAWAAMNLVTECVRENAAGTCTGERTCGLHGLSACDAPVAAAETCNGLDDDCNGAVDDIVEEACTQEDNGVGACPGVTVCDAETEICAGTPAVAEACNLVDDDCDGDTDEGTCNDGLACTDDVCAGDDECQNPIQEGQCLIDGVCVAEDEPNPDFPCQRCVPAVSQTAWTGSGDGPSCFIGGECWPAGAGKPDEPCLRCRPEVSTTTWSPAATDTVIACDDGNACTQDDTCSGASCAGSAYTCDDGKQCTDNVCDGEGGCSYPVVAGACLIDDSCYLDGDRADAITCRVCDADVPTAWSAPESALSCDDGELCTSEDVCSGSTCAGTAYDCDDMTACTIDACDGAGGCVHTTAESFCMIDGACYADSAVDPNNGCRACDVTTSASSWTPYDASEHVSCDDVNDCTHTDECTAGQCLGTPYSCADGKPCTDDVCAGDGTCSYPIQSGNCLIDGTCYSDGGRQNTTGCNVCSYAVSQTAWTQAAPGAGLSCDDGNSCSWQDSCNGIGCQGSVYSCDDRLSCTTDSCDGNGGCSNVLTAGACAIDGACYADGQVNPDNSCLYCDPSTPNSWTAKDNGAFCDDGDLCTYGDQCTFAKCLAIPYDCIGQGCCVGDGTCTTTPPQGVVEQCNNNIDDDCDGVTDEGQPEVCADNIDNDCDGDTDESANTWGEVFFARGWRENVTTPTVAIYTSNLNGTFQSPKVLDFPADRAFGIAGVGDFDADRFLDLIVAERVYGADHDPCVTTSDCPGSERCIGGGCVPTNCEVNGCAGAAGTECFDLNEHHDAFTTDFACLAPIRYYLARETCPSGSIGLSELFTLPPGDTVRAILDVDNDGHLDFVVNKHWAERRGYVMLNAGDPGDIEFTKVEYRAGGTTPMLPMPGGTPATIQNRPCTWVYNISRTSKDLDGDGIVDLLGFCNPNGGSTPPTLWWWRGRGDGSFEAKQNMGASTSGATPFALQTMNDFNRDGSQDIIGGMDDDGNSGSIWALLHRSISSADHWAPAYMTYDVVPGSASGEAPGAGGGTSGDFNRDGYADLLVGWAPDIPECQDIQSASCTFAQLAVLTNVTRDPCPQGESCNGTTCEGPCLSACQAGWECGPDTCGHPNGCGTCEANEICKKHTCVAREDCVANCAGKECGDNGCGGVCGFCADGKACQAGACVDASSCGTCSGKTCGTDDCGMPCVVFENTYQIPQDENTRGAEGPTNVPPTAPVVAVEPQAPGTTQDLVCTVVVPSYDLDPVQYLYRWYRSPDGLLRGTFVGEVSNRPVVPASMTAPGQVWHCEVTATDRLEYSPRASSPSVTIQGGISATPSR